MSASNPFRRNLDGGAATAVGSTAQPTNTLASSLTSSPSQAIPLVPDFPRKSSLSLEIEEDDSSSSDEQTADPFNPDSSVSDTEDDDNIQSSKSSAPGDRPRPSFGSAPHSAPSTDGSSTPPSEGPLTTNEYDERSTARSTTSSTDQDITPSLNRPTAVYEHKQSTSPTSRANRDKKPPPPPRSHHGKRISTAANPPPSQSASKLSPTSSRSDYQLSFQSASPESLATSQPVVTPNASSVQSPIPDYFSPQSQSQVATGSNETLSRSGSQHKRAPPPPLGRRQSQMRSKSNESKSNISRLALSSPDSEDIDGSQPPSPGPSIISARSFSRDRNRMSMPPPTSAGSPGDVRPSTSSAGVGHLSPPTNSQPPQPGRRTSSYGNIASGSSVAPPPPPPPRRAREGARSSEGRPVSQIITTDEPLPQPSNAKDILADLLRLQKEVDDFRGNYESRKASE
ncbi:hypothetical protein N7466_006187 [Penicillium verhagenii]|uniref:uncharacterized protein n=1 Tax=Penicillium verhagenii TaxID=1562060 RepID=UPI0025456D91|nr:uncharacterized protein N7466_006187 [Penicillium verhagenii]KAJ5930694.1 hypothetical protein N7466_006187 [Penicillium verhagenii]